MYGLTKKMALDVLGTKAEITGPRHDRRAFAPFESGRMEWNEEKKSNVDVSYIDQARILPQQEDTPGNAQVFIVREGWRRAWSSACTHASTDTTRPHLSTIYYDSDDDRLVATDGHRLCSLPFFPRDVRGNRPASMMLPLIHIHNLGQSLRELTFWIEDNRAHFKIDGMVVSAPMYKGSYSFPSYQWILPKISDRYAAHVNATRWADIVRKCPTTTGAINYKPVTYSRAALVAEAETANDDKTIEPWKTSLLMPGDFVWREGVDLKGWVKPFESEIQPWMWGSNAHYMADGIDAVPADEVRIMLPALPTDPFHIGQAKGDSIDLDGPISVVMPCRL